LLKGCSTITKDCKVLILVQQASTRYRITKTATSNANVRSNNRETGTVSNTKQVEKGQEASSN
jgi:hypothetical protein